MDRKDKILEGLTNESFKYEFKKNVGCSLKTNIGDLRRGTLFYCREVMKDRVRLVKQSDKSYELILPKSFAEVFFTNAEGFTNGKSYDLKRGMFYLPKSVIISYGFDEEWSDEFIEKYTYRHKGEEYIYFPKGTVFKYVGQDMAGDNFTVDGEPVSITSFEEIEDAGLSASDYFKI